MHVDPLKEIPFFVLHVSSFLHTLVRPLVMSSENRALRNWGGRLFPCKWELMNLIGPYCYKVENCQV